MTTEKSQIRVSIPDYVINQLELVFKDRRLNNRSELITEYCKEGLAKEEILTLPVRQANIKDVISSKLDTLLSTKYLVSSGSIMQKFESSFAMDAQFGVSSGTQNAKKAYEVALFDLLDDLKYVDIEEYNRIMVIFTKYTTLKGKYKKYVQILTGQSTL